VIISRIRILLQNIVKVVVAETPTTGSTATSGFTVVKLDQDGKMLAIRVGGAKNVIEGYGELGS